MRRPVIVFATLAGTQIIGWGATGALAVLAPAIAHDLNVPLPGVFLATSVLFVAMGLAAPFAGRALRHVGPTRTMAAGSVGMGAGLCLVAAAPSQAVFLAGWATVGGAGAFFLTTAAYVYLAGAAGARARGVIGSLMLVTGLAGSIFWPVTAYLEERAGWRGAVLAFAGILALLVPPLVLFALPGVAAAGPDAKSPRRVALHHDRTFILMVGAIALFSFVTFGIEAVGIALFQAMGADLTRAVGIASLLGLFKVGGRVIDLLGGRNWDGLSTALVCGAMIPLGLLPVAVFGGGDLPVAAYLCLFGAGSGAFAVARATMPLVLFRNGDYAAAMATIALPMNLINALAPPMLAAILVAIGPRAVLALLAGVSAIAFAVLLHLNTRRPPAD